MRRRRSSSTCSRTMRPLSVSARPSAELGREKRKQKALIGIKDKYGKNAIVKGLNMQEGATGMERSRQIGRHKALGNLNGKCKGNLR